MSETRRRVSVVLPCLNEASHIRESARKVARALEDAGVVPELVLVDDGSEDDTWEALLELARDLEGTKALRLSRRFGKEQALCAGIENATGDAVCVMDADLQHPPELLGEMVRAWRDEGFEVVEARKSDRGDESVLSRLEAKLFYSILRRLSGYDLRGASDYKLMDRKVVDAWMRLPERNLFFRGMSAWLGFRRKEIPFEVRSRAGGASGWNLRSLVRLAITGITAFSSLPIHIVTLTGFLFLLFALGLGAQTLYNFLTHHAQDGFTTVILLVLITGSATMIGLGVIGLYVSRIYDEVKGRPRYLIADRTDDGP